MRKLYYYRFIFVQLKELFPSSLFRSLYVRTTVNTHSLSCVCRYFQVDIEENSINLLNPTVLRERLIWKTMSLMLSHALTSSIQKNKYKRTYDKAGETCCYTALQCTKPIIPRLRLLCLSGWHRVSLPLRLPSLIFAVGRIDTGPV